MNIKISVPARLNFFRRHEKFLIKFLVKLIKNQASFGGNEGAVRIRIFLVSDIHDRLAFFINIVHHAYEVLFIVTVIAVALCNDRLHIFQRAFHDIVHDLYRDFLLIHLIHPVHHRLTDMPFFFLRKFRQCTVSAFSDSIDDLLNIKALQAAVFLDNLNIPGRLILAAVILIRRMLLL